MTKVFMLSMDNAPDHVNAFEIQNWTHYATHHKLLTNDATEFCKLAQQYDIDEFQEAFNLDTFSATDNYIFITDLYEDVEEEEEKQEDDEYSDWVQTQ